MDQKEAEMTAANEQLKMKILTDKSY